MLELIAPLVVQNTTKIVVLSLDGLAGLPRRETGRSELETARLPNLSALAAESACGLIRHVAPGITPGSGPGRSEEHTSELQSRLHLVCRLLLEKKKRHPT